ncbi:MAG: 2OG-Fe(II) oxygenase, partial [Pseudomonadota bacterium]|nr:2OG-Fe(II) oxygenase [Pseudomonadota bacterium]
HMNCRGAMLKLHADFNRHPNWHLDRRLNLLLYLNQDWQASFGGDLELWDREMAACRQRIAPVAGRCVIFSTSSTSFHGHPDPIECPDDVTRKSIALYYYTNVPREDAAQIHSTLWQSRPDARD